MLEVVFLLAAEVDVHETRDELIIRSGASIRPFGMLEVRQGAATFRP